MSQNRKVKSASLHSAIQIAEYGQLGGSKRVEPHGPKGNQPGIDVFKTEDGLLIVAQNGKFEVLVPFANVAMMVMTPEENETVRSKDNSSKD